MTSLAEKAAARRAANIRAVLTKTDEPTPVKAKHEEIQEHKIGTAHEQESGLEVKSITHQEERPQILIEASVCHAGKASGLSDIKSSPSQQNKTPSAEDQALYDWIIGLRVEQLPEVPFNLYQGVRVTGGEVFLKSLQQQATRGANEARARNGVLQDDIRQLKKIIESKIT